MCCAIAVSAQEPSGQQKSDSSDASSQNRSESQTPHRPRVSREVAEQLVKKKVPPHYPDAARAQHVEGVVLLQVDIDREGIVEKVVLISGHPLLAPAAIEAVQEWRYKPFKLNGEPFPIETQVLITFSLRR